MRRVLDVLDRVICVSLAVLLCVMLVVGSMQIVYRYILQTSLSWSEEMLRYLYVWATMLGVSLGIRRKSFAAIESLLDFVGKRSEGGKKAMCSVAFIVQILVFGFLLIFGIQLANKSGVQTSPALLWKMRYIYLAFPIGGSLALLFTFEEIYDFFFAKSSDAKKGAKE